MKINSDISMSFVMITGYIIRKLDNNIAYFCLYDVCPVSLLQKLITLNMSVTSYMHPSCILCIVFQSSFVHLILYWLQYL